MRAALPIVLAAALAAAAAPVRAADAPPTPAKPAPPKPAPAKPLSPAETEKALYGLGLAVANSLEVFNLSSAELETVLRGVREGWAGKPKAQLDTTLQQRINELAIARAPRAAEKTAAREQEAGAAYLAKMAKERGARKTPSGAIVIPEKEGSGANPAPTDKVKVNYTGTLVSGRVFDSTAQRGPAEFPLRGVIRCWTEAIPTLKVGGKARIVCPSEIAYGASGTAGIPGNAVLTFDVELLEIVK